MEPPSTGAQHRLRRAGILIGWLSIGWRRPSGLRTSCPNCRRLQPLRYIIELHGGRRIAIQLGAGAQPALHWILMDVTAKALVFLPGAHAAIVKAGLPDGKAGAEL